MGKRDFPDNPGVEPLDPSSEPSQNIMGDDSTYKIVERSRLGIKNEFDRKWDNNLAVQSHLINLKKNFIVRWILEGNYHLVLLYLKQNGLILKDDVMIERAPKHRYKFPEPLPIMTRALFQALLDNRTNEHYMADFLAFAQHEAQLSLLEHLQWQLYRLPLVHFQLRTDLYTSGLERFTEVNIDGVHEEAYGELSQFKQFVNQALNEMRAMKTANYETQDGHINEELLDNAKYRQEDILEEIAQQLDILTRRFSHVAPTPIAEFNRLWQEMAREDEVLSQNMADLQQDLQREVEDKFLDTRQMYQDKIDITIKSLLYMKKHYATQVDVDKINLSIQRLQTNAMNIQQATSALVIKSELKACTDTLRTILPEITPLLRSSTRSSTTRPLPTVDLFEATIASMERASAPVTRNHQQMDADIANVLRQAGVTMRQNPDANRPTDPPINTPHERVKAHMSKPDGIVTHGRKFSPSAPPMPSQSQKFNDRGYTEIPRSFGENTRVTHDTQAQTIQIFKQIVQEKQATNEEKTSDIKEVPADLVAIDEDGLVNLMHLEEAVCQCDGLDMLQHRVSQLRTLATERHEVSMTELESILEEVEEGLESMPEYTVELSSIYEKLDTVIANLGANQPKLK